MMGRVVEVYWQSPRSDRSVSAQLAACAYLQDWQGGECL